MDDDSQDEVIKKDATLGKIKRTNALLFSDSESSDGNSGNSDDTGSEEEDTDEDGDEEGEDEDLEDSEEDEEEEDDIEIAAEQPTHLVKGKPQLNGGAAASSDEDAEKCPICLNTLRDQEVGTPENCAHYFCSDCIVEWSKNANSCPVDRMSFKFICIREHFGGAILKKVPVENTQSQEDEVEDDPTFCEVCGRSDREDRLLLCDGCDAGYHMECLNPPMSEVPVAEWFCPPCTLANAGRVDDETDHVSEEEVAFLRADVVPSTSRLRPNVRTRAIARTRQSERVRATVNRNRITTAQRIQHVPRYLMSSLDETIETVAAGLSTAVYQRPLTPRAPSRRKRKVGRRRKRVASKKRHTQSSVGKKSTGTWIKRRKRRTKRRRVKKIKLKTETTARSRIAKTLRLGKPVHSTSIPSMHKPTEPSLGLLRADIGAASLSVFGDPFEFDPYDSDEEFPVNSASPLSAKRRVLSQSALRSHCPVARPVAVGLPGSSVPSLIPEPEAASADLLGTILAGQTRLMMSSSDVVINRDGSLTTKKVPRLHANSVSNSKAEESSEDGSQPGASQLGTPVISSNDESLGSLLLNTNSRLTSSNTYSASLHIASKAVSPLQAPLGKAPIKFEYSMTPRSVQTHNLANLNRCTPKLGETSRFNGNVPSVDPHSASSKLHSNSRSFTKTVLVKQPFKPIPKRPDISELPRIPKIKKEENSGHLGSQSASGDVPSSCITQLTGKGSTNQPIRDSKMESGKSNATQHRSCASGGSLSANTVAHSSSVCSPSIGKAGSSSFESFKINIPGNVGHSSRLSNPGFCNTFRPVDNKAQQKEKNSPFFSLKKAKPVKSEIYDPFDPTGSDSSSANSSPERLPLTNITRTISIASPQIQTFQTVRRITHYTLENIFGSGADLSDVPSGNTESHDNVMIQERLVKQISDTEQENVEEESSNISFPSSAIKQVPDEEHLNEDDKDNTRIVFEDDHGKPRVKMELDSPIWDEHQNIPKNGQAEKTSFSRSPSNSSFWNQKKFKKEKATTKEFKCTRSQSRSRDRSSSSTSRSVEESYSKSHKVKSKDRQSSSDHSSSHERSQKKKAKNKTKNKKSSWAKEHRRSRSRSSSPGNSPVEFYESRKKKHSSSRAKGRERSRSNSTDRSKKKKHRRERCYDRYEKERTSRRRSRSREKRRKRSRSPSASGYWELKGTKSRERSLQSRSCSKEIKWKPKETPPLPLQEKDHRSSDDNIDNSFEYDPSSKQEPEEMMEETLTIYQETIPVQEIPPKGNTVEADLKESIAAERICEKFISDAVLSRSECSNTRVLPDSIEYFMKMELTDSNNSLELSSQNKIKLEEISIKEEDNDICPFLIDFPVEKEKLEQEPVETAIQVSSKIRIEAQDGDIVLGDNVADVNKPEIEACAQDPALKSKALVKRVTWNLQEEEDDIVAVEKTRVPFCKQRMKEGVWKAEDLTQTINQVQLTEPPPTNYMIPEPMFPDLDSSQVYNQNLPLTAPLPSGLPPYAPVSQPTVQFIMQGSLPLLSCVAGQGLTPEPGNLATASEPGTQAASTGEMEEKVKALKSPVDKTKNEEYMKKLHMQERAVEEVKLAIKPFYQRREISKEEYKEILRKAVQKICHSKSGEINPVKVANLVKAYVEKYKHMRKHKKTDPEEELHEMGN